MTGWHTDRSDSKVLILDYRGQTTATWGNVKLVDIENAISIHARGHCFLTPELAREIARRLLAFADRPGVPSGEPE